MSAYCENCEERGEAAEKDAERYQKLKRLAPGISLLAHAWVRKEGRMFDNIDDALDAIPWEATNPIKRQSP